MNSKLYKYEIDALARHFLIQKRILKEFELGITDISKYDLAKAKRLTGRIYLLLDNLDDNSRFIIQNEVVLGKKGAWYYGFLSPSTYYRHRNVAYIRFLEYFRQ